MYLDYLKQINLVAYELLKIVRYLKSNFIYPDIGTIPWIIKTKDLK